MNTTDPVLFYRTTNSIEAKSLALRLEAADIEARLTGETLYEAYAGLGLAQTAPVDVWISSADREAAMPLLNEWREERGHATRNVRPRKFQFSLMSLLLVTTVFAVFAWIMAFNGETGADIIAVILSAILYLAPPTVYFYRRYFRTHPRS